jgi:hypothetical protein
VSSRGAGIFFSSDPRTAFVSRGAGVFAGRTIYNAWDLEQLHAFGAQPDGVPPLIELRGKRFGRGSLVSGPDVLYTHDASNQVGPWQRIAYGGSMRASARSALAASTEVGVMGSHATSVKSGASSSQGAGPSWTAIRWAMGRKASPSAFGAIPRVLMQITNATAFLSDFWSREALRWCAGFTRLDMSVASAATPSVVNPWHVYRNNAECADPEMEGSQVRVQAWSTPESCKNRGDGMLHSFHPRAASYEWDDGVSTAASFRSGVKSGQYRVLALDERRKLIGSASTTLLPRSGFAVFLSFHPPNCTLDGSSASIFSVVLDDAKRGPTDEDSSKRYQYLWNTGYEKAHLSGKLTPGLYNLTVTDALTGCSEVASMLLTGLVLLGGAARARSLLLSSGRQRVAPCNSGGDTRHVP